MNLPIQISEPADSAVDEIVIKLSKRTIDIIQKCNQHCGISVPTAAQMLIDNLSEMEQYVVFSHYTYLSLYAEKFCKEINVDNVDSMSAAHGDKAYQYKDKWQKAGISFPKGVMLYLLTYEPPFSKQVRETEKGWVDPGDWVINTYNNYQKIRVAIDKLP